LRPRLSPGGWLTKRGRRGTEKPSLRAAAGVRIEIDRGPEALQECDGAWLGLRWPRTVR